MAQGPPPSAAGPSNSPHPEHPQNTPQEFFQYSPQQLQNAQAQSHPYYNYSQNWPNQPWPVASFPYAPAYQQQYAYQPTHFHQYQPPPPQQIPSAPSHPPIPSRKPRTPSPSPPPPELPKYWDAALKSFLERVGLTQAAAGFECDMLVMNAEWELKEVQPALAELRDTLTRLLEPKTGASSDSAPSERTLEERKLDYVHLEQGAEPRSQTSTNKAISLLLARNRARNDASNRSEFLYTRAKRRRVSPSSTDPPDDDALHVSSCARADAKPVDRDVMMKFDVARNEEGPLRRTVAKLEMGTITSTVAGTQERRSGVEENAAVSAEKYPALDVRLKDIESHLAVRYVPSPPVSLLHRLQFLEDHIVRLEREYPPWAALHFNQPRRGWPPPPRATPLIVPSHLTSTSTSTSSAAAPSASVGNGSPAAAIETGKAGVEHEAKGKSKGRTAKSSLHRAVMERLEVQKAMGDLKGDDASY